MDESPEVHLFDAHVYIFRSYYSLPEMSAPDGTPTNAAYGFANTLVRYLAERSPSHVACCFDHDLTSFRNEIFPGYKASRGTEAPPDLAPQFELCKDAARALGIQVFEREGYEADDVIATLCDGLLAVGAGALVVTADKDLAQLATEDERVCVYDLQRDRHLTAKGVFEHFGVEPGQIPDYLALLGDSIDDLPGVPGFGKKSAAAALLAFETLDRIPTDPAAWADVPVRGARRLAESLAKHREQALQVRELATVVRDVPDIRARPKELAWKGADPALFESLATRLGWGRIATRIPRWQ